jgi:hypothetical protein
MPTNDTFETNDIHLSAFILATHAGKFRGITWKREDEAVFIFRPSPVKNIVAEYLNGGQAPARTLFELLRSLRTQLNQTRPSR